MDYVFSKDGNCFSKNNFFQEKFPRFALSFWPTGRCSGPPLLEDAGETTIMQMRLFGRKKKLGKRPFSFPIQKLEGCQRFATVSPTKSMCYRHSRLSAFLFKLF